MTQTPYTLEQLSALSNEALDIEVAKLKGFNITRGWKYWSLNHPEGLVSSLNQFPVHVWLDEEQAWGGFYEQHSRAQDHATLQQFSTDANAALLLLDEMLESGPAILGTGHFFADSAEIVLENERGAEGSVLINGKPSVALPRAITIAYIRIKQQSS